MMKQEDIIDRLKHPLMNTSQHAVEQNAVTLAFIEQQTKEIAKLREDSKKFADIVLDRMNTFGTWEDGCFYYNRTCASELQILIDMAEQAIKEAHP